MPGAATITLPLTTLFTPPSWCAQQVYTSSAQYHGTPWYKQAYPPPSDAHYLESCYPSSYLSRLATGPTKILFSPGVCPSGYIAASIEERVGSNGAVTSHCCPSYATSFDAERGCQTLVTTSTIVAKNAAVNSSITTPFVAAAWNVKVVWASSDLDRFTPRSAPLLTQISSTSTSTSTSVTKTPPPSSSRSSKPSHNNDTGLSTGAKAGIGVGVAAAVLIALIIGMAIFLRRGKRRQREQVNNSPTSSQPLASQVGESRMNGDKPQIHQLDSLQIHGPHEADSRQPPAELEGERFR